MWRMDKDAQDEVMTNSKKFYAFDTIQLYHIKIQLYYSISTLFSLIMRVLSNNNSRHLSTPNLTDATNNLMPMWTENFNIEAH